MINLDNDSLVKKFDPDNNLMSVDLLSRQLAQAWQEFKKVLIPASYKTIDKIVINGMGGSALPGGIIMSVYFEELKIPLLVINSYKVPATVDKKTLYIICSYSGTTEEPVSTFLAAKKKGAKVFAITSGGPLGDLVMKGKTPGYMFDPVANPSGQPRIGLGYTLGAHLALFKRLGLIKLNDQEVRALLTIINKFKSQFNFKSLSTKNLAKQLAIKTHGRELLIFASEHLIGNAHTFANQINETSKTLSAYHALSELNHHLLEGLKFPKTNRSHLHIVMLESDLYHSKNQTRYQVTKKIIKNNGVGFSTYKLKSKTRLAQSLEALTLSSYVTFYLALLNRVNPNLIPYVDYLKAQLKKYS